MFRALLPDAKPAENVPEQRIGADLPRDRHELLVRQAQFLGQ
jgi:hypothetical protein